MSTSSQKLQFDALREIWSCEEGQGITEYAVLLAAILLIVIGTLRLIGGRTNHIFSSVAGIFGGSHGD